MSKVLTVAWRDFKQTVLRKAFLIAIVAIPVVIVGLMVLMGVLMATHKEPPLIGTLAIVDPTGEVTEAARGEFEPKRIADDQQKHRQEMERASREMMAGRPSPSAVETTQGAGSFQMGIGTGEVKVAIEAHGELDQRALDRLKKRVEQADLLGAAVMPAGVLETPDPQVPREQWATFDLYIGEGVDNDHAAFIEQQLGDAIVRVRADRAGLDPDRAMAMLRRPASSTRRVLAGGEEAAEGEGTRIAKQMIPMAFMMLLFAGVFTGGNHLMMSTIEEKSNRVMEVLLSAVSPLQLMGGKIIAQCGVGLLLVVIYATLPLVGLFAFDQQDKVELVNIAYLFIYFFMAFFMVGSIMAAVGSAVTDIREANTLITPVMIMVWIPWILWMPISQAPNGPVALAFSFIPPAVPFIMILRLAADEPVPLWQVGASIVWGYACVVGMIWMAAKIFRVGVLMYGKPPSPFQMLKWVRYT
jgi:ABC-2 type transport system permease protein